MRRGEGLPIDGRITAAFRCLALTLTLMLSGPLFAADFTCAPRAESVLAGEQDEAEEVSSSARETVSSPKLMQAWLRRLSGRYTYEGYVDLCGKGNPADRRPVKGRADCIAVSAAPDVHCAVNVTWPAARRADGAPVLGGVSNLAPAQYLFSIEYPKFPTPPVPTLRIPYVRGEGANHWGIVAVQVDNMGNGEWASGVLVGDTFLSTEPCVDIQGDCRKVTRITAKPGANEISMTVEVTIARQRVLRQAFLLHREPDVRKGQ
jgi:hypothetical protein